MIQIIRETHDTPESVQRMLTLAGGKNLFAEPMYRAIWGWNRLTWIGGKKVATLGPYPHRGEYEHAFVVQSAKGEFIQLTATIAERIARAIECSRTIPAAKRRAALYGREAKLDKEYVDWAMDVMDDGDHALHGQPFVTVA